MDENFAGKIVRAKVPLGEMFGYATDLRSSSQGRATFTMEFAEYAEVPDAHRRSNQGAIAKQLNRLAE